MRALSIGSSDILKALPDFSTPSKLRDVLLAQEIGLQETESSSVSTWLLKAEQGQLRLSDVAENRNVFNKINSLAELKKEQESREFWTSMGISAASLATGLAVGILTRNGRAAFAASALIEGAMGGWESYQAHQLVGLTEEMIKAGSGKVGEADLAQERTLLQKRERAFNASLLYLPVRMALAALGGASAAKVSAHFAERVGMEILASSSVGALQGALMTACDPRTYFDKTASESIKEIGTSLLFGELFGLGISGSAVGVRSLFRRFALHMDMEESALAAGHVENRVHVSTVNGEEKVNGFLKMGDWLPSVGERTTLNSPQNNRVQLQWIKDVYWPKLKSRRGADEHKEALSLAIRLAEAFPEEDLFVFPDGKVAFKGVVGKVGDAERDGFRWEGSDRAEYLLMPEKGRVFRCFKISFLEFYTDSSGRAYRRDPLTDEFIEIMDRFGPLIPVDLKPTGKLLYDPRSGVSHGNFSKIELEGRPYYHLKGPHALLSEDGGVRLPGYCGSIPSNQVTWRFSAPWNIQPTVMDAGASQSTDVMSNFHLSEFVEFLSKRPDLKRVGIYVDSQAFTVSRLKGGRFQFDRIPVQDTSLQGVPFFDVHGSGKFIRYTTRFGSNPYLQVPMPILKQDRRGQWAYEIFDRGAPERRFTMPMKRMEEGLFAPEREFFWGESRYAEVHVGKDRRSSSKMWGDDHVLGLEWNPFSNRGPDEHQVRLFRRTGEGLGDYQAVENYEGKDFIVKNRAVYLKPTRPLTGNFQIATRLGSSGMRMRPGDYLPLDAEGHPLSIEKMQEIFEKLKACKPLNPPKRRIAKAEAVIGNRTTAREDDVQLPNQRALHRFRAQEVRVGHVTYEIPLPHPRYGDLYVPSVEDVKEFHRLLTWLLPESHVKQFVQRIRFIMGSCPRQAAFYHLDKRLTGFYGGEARTQDEWFAKSAADYIVHEISGHGIERNNFYIRDLIILAMTLDNYTAGYAKEEWREYAAELAVRFFLYPERRKEFEHGFILYEALLGLVEKGESWGKYWNPGTNDVLKKLAQVPAIALLLAGFGGYFWKDKQSV